MVTIIFIISLWTIGLFIASEPGMLLEKPKNWLLSISGGKWWVKPVISCVICMPSVHGLLINILFACRDGFTGWLPAQWIITSVSAVAINSIIWNIIKILRNYYSWQQESYCECPEINDIKTN